MKPEVIKVACSNCNLRELCMPMGLSEMGNLMGKKCFIKA